MIQIQEGFQLPAVNPLFGAMHQDRKRVFVDLLKWDVPVVDGMFEIDQFDGPDAVYVIATDELGRHCGSIRLLPSSGPHILGSIFPELCDGDVPVAKNIRELSRGCLSPRLRAADRLQVRNALTSAVVEYGLLKGLSAYTCIADSGWYSQILSLGWMVRPLGLPQILGSTTTGALRIDIDEQTPDRLRAAGTYVPLDIVVLADSGQTIAA